MVEPKQPEVAAPGRLARLWRWTWRATLGLLVVVALTAGAALLFVESDAGRDFAREQAAEQGLALDYADLELSPARGALRLTELRLPMPEGCRAHGDAWLVVDHLDVTWSASALVRGIVRELRVVVDGVELTHALDAEGTDCVALALAALLDGGESTDATPLSHVLAALELPPELEGAELVVRGVRIRHVDADGPSLEVVGLELDADARVVGGTLRGEATLRSSDEGLVLRIDGNEARLAMEHRVVLGSEVTLTSRATLLALELTEPLLDVEALALPRALVALEAAARFEPDAARTTFQVERVAVLGDVISGSGGVSLHDGVEMPRVEASSLVVDLAPLAAAIPELVDLALDDVGATLRVTPEGDALGLTVDAHARRLALPEERAMVADLIAEGRGRFADERLSFDARVRVGSLTAREGDASIALETFALEARAVGLALDASAGEVHAQAELGAARARTATETLTTTSARVSLDASDVREPRGAVEVVGLELEAGSSRVAVPTLELALSARDVDPSFPAPVRFEGAMRAPRLLADASGVRVSPRDLVISFDGAARSATALDLRTRVRVAALEASQASLSAEVAGLDAQLSLTDLALDEPRARVALRARTRRVDLRDAIQHVVIDGLGLDSQAPWAGGVPSRLSGSIPLGAIRYATADREPVPLVARGELTWTLSELRLDPILARSRARVSADVQLWPVAGAVPEETEEERVAREERRAARRAARAAEAAARGEEVVEAPPSDAPRERTLRASVRGRFDRGNGALDVELRGRTVAMLAPLVGMDELALERARARMTLNGRYAGLDRPSPEITHHGELRLRRIGYRGATGEDLVFPRVIATLDHRARGASHDLTLRTELEAPTLGEETLPHGVTLVTTAQVNLDALTAHVEARTEDAGDIQLGLELDASLEDGAVVHRERLVAEGLRGLSAWMPPTLRLRVDSAQLEGEGRIEHAIDAQEPAFDQTLRLAVSSLRHRERGGVRVSVPKVLFVGKLRGDAAGLSGDAEVELTTVDALDGLHRVTAHDTRQLVRFSATGALGQRRWSVHTEGSVGQIEQDFVPAYPMEALTLAADMVFDRRSFRMERFELVNARGGTRFSMEQAVEQIGRDRDAPVPAAPPVVEVAPTDPEEIARAERRRRRREERLAREAAEPPSTRPPAPPPQAARVVVRGRLEQDLSRLDGAPQALRAGGRVVLPFTLESGDGSLFRMSARAELDDVDLSLPGLGISVRGVRANVPVEEAFLLGADGFHVVVNTERSAFARVRHQELRADLDDEAFVQIEHLRVGEIELGPMTGGLRLDRNVLAMEGVRMRHGEALITGQVLVDYLPGRERVTFRGNITGLRTRTSRSPLDANAAVVFTPSRLELDGRIQIVRMATAHLRGLLDLLDPYREDPSFNSLRSVLRFAHPKHVSVDLAQGLMSLQVELGGIVGRFVDVSAIRGIPLGPLMNRHVAPLLGRDE